MWFSAGSCDTRALRGIDRLHQIDLDLERAGARDGDVLVDVLALAPVVARRLETEEIDPEAAEAGFVGGADGDLLEAENAKRTICHAPRFITDLRASPRTGRSTARCASRHRPDPDAIPPRA